MALDSGTHLGPYEILGPLGAGGMGEVYLAKDARLGRKVAVKVLPPHMSEDGEAMRRFEREARALAALSHPNILTIFDFNTDQGVSFAVTELLEGETLRGFIRRPDSSWKDTLPIAVAVAEGLAAAHSKGVIHRDLKPENVFLTSDGRVKILDFGLVRWKEIPTEPENITTRAATEPGLVLGTIQYMSPEQLRGDPIDARSDIFAFGCLLYEMLTGKNPFAHETVPETMAAILRDTPTKVSELSKDVPLSFEQIVNRCLEKNPEDRFQSTQDVLTALRSIREGSLSIRLSAILPARLLRYALLGSLALLAAAWLFLYTGKERTIHSLAVLPLENTGANPNAEYLSDGITESIINSLSQIPNLKVMARTSVFRYKNTKIDPQKAGKELKVDAVLIGKVTQRGDTLTVQADLVDVADGSELWGEQYNCKLSDLLDVQEQIAKQISGKLQIKLTGEEQKRITKHYTENTEAYQLYLKGRFFWNKRTGEDFLKGIQYFKQAIEIDPNYALAYVGLADCYALLGAYSILPPREAIPKAQAAAKRALELDEFLAEAHASLGLTSFLYGWDWPQAEKQFQRAIHIKPSYPTAHHWYGEYFIAMGRTREALAELKKAQELDPLSIIISTDIGRASYFARNYDQAIEQLRNALDMEPGFVQSHTGLIMAYEQKSMYEQAIADGERMLDRKANVLLGRLYAASGKKEEAKKILAELHEKSRQVYVSPYSFVLLYLALGENEQAFEWLEKAYQERSEWLAYLGVDPRLDSLRSDPRFADLLTRLGFP